MSTRAPVSQSNQTAQLCNYCHQKPKFSNHLYCSKTCAGQAATLCNHCHKKPKFQTFDYCGKNCATLANPVKAHTAGASAPQGQTGTNTKAAGYPKGSNFNSQSQSQPAPAAQPAFDPVQLAKLVAQHIPQVQAILNPGTAAPVTQSMAVPVAPAAQSVPNPHSNNPFLNLTNQNAIQAPSLGVPNGTLAASSKSLSAAQLHISTQQVADDLECLIPGCGQPVHVDAKGLKTSDYCSLRHREEAVVSGLVSPCIMCMTFPQSDTDYFCSKACRDEAMDKHLDADE